MAKEDNELKFTYSGILVKNKQKIVSVRFERNKGNDFAEGILPDCTIEKSSGFTEEEKEQLEVYLMENVNDIMKRAKR